MPGGAPGQASIPGSISGGPDGPGGPDVTSAGPGEGRQAAAEAAIRAVMPVLHRALAAFEIGSDKYHAILRSVTELAKGFGPADKGQGLVPAAILQMARQARQGGGLPPGAPPGAVGRPAPPAMPGMAPPATP